MSAIIIKTEWQWHKNKKEDNHNIEMTAKLEHTTIKNSLCIHFLKGCCERKNELTHVKCLEQCCSTFSNTGKSQKAKGKVKIQKAMLGKFEESPIKYSFYVIHLHTELKKIT